MKLTSALLAVSSLLIAGSRALADLPPVSAGESVVFSEDFEDNRNVWSNIGLVGQAGRPASTEAKIADSEWTPSLADHVGVQSALTFKTPPSLKNGTVSVYIAVRVKDAQGTDGNRFTVTLVEQDASKAFVRLVIRPAGPGFIEYRDAAKKGKSVSIKSAKEAIQASFGPQAFKLTVTPAIDGKSPASAEAFYYDAKSAGYLSLGKVDADIGFLEGLFTSISISNRNGVEGTVWFDSVVVTQLEPKP